MPNFSTKSRIELNTCERVLQELFNTVVNKFDCSILEGHRGEAKQNANFYKGVSKVRYPYGKHNSTPSKAVDAGPYIAGRGIPWPKTPTDWNDRYQRNNYIKDMMQFAHYAGYVQGTADNMGINIRWGGDWDQDNDLRDNAFDDLVHFELV